MTADPLPRLKTCTKCRESKPLDEFALDPRRPARRRARCKDCARTADRARYAADPIKHRAKARRQWHCDPVVSRERQRRRRADDPEREAAYRAGRESRARRVAAAYHAAHAAEINAKKAEYYRLHPEKQSARWRKYVAKNPEKVAEGRARWSRLNAELVRERLAAWRSDHPEAVTAQVQNRRARKLNATGSHTRQEVEDLFLAQGGRCANPYCQVDLVKGRRALDHVVALARDGSNSIENLQWLCRPCNSRKATLPMARWLEREARRLLAS